MDDLSLWESSSAAWIASQGELGDESRQFLDPFVWSELGDLAGKRVLDVGCGEGRFARLLTKRGAVVSAVEPAAGLRSVAESHGVDVIDGLATQLPFGDAAFDVVLQYLVLIDVEDFESAIREAVRVLRPGGTLLIVNLSAIATSSERFWLRDENGEKEARLVEFYGESKGVVYTWSGITVRNYHRPLQSYFDACLAAGLRLARFVEPMPEPTATDWTLDNRIAPNFVIFNWQKPSI